MSTISIVYNTNSGEPANSFTLTETATMADLFNTLYKIDSTITKVCRVVLGQNEYSFENHWSKTLKELGFKKRSSIQLARDVRAA
jgi:hypothetical protein